MPVFSQQVKEVKKRGKRGIPQEVIDEYMKYIEDLKKENTGRLEFGKAENINLARKSLKEAGIQLKRQVKIRKPKGEANVLVFERVARKKRAVARKAAQTKSTKSKSR